MAMNNFLSLPITANNRSLLGLGLFISLNEALWASVSGAIWRTTGNTISQPSYLCTSIAAVHAHRIINLVYNSMCMHVTMYKKSELMLMKRATASRRLSWSISSIFQRKFTSRVRRSLK